MNILSQLGITLPIVIAILGAAWLQNRRIDAMDASVKKRIDDLRAEIMPILRDMQASLKDLERRVTILEERTGPIVRR